MSPYLTAKVFYSLIYYGLDYNNIFIFCQLMFVIHFMIFFSSMPSAKRRIRDFVVFRPFPPSTICQNVIY
jgi:hypothetical protein